MLISVNAKFWVAIFPFVQKWHHVLLSGGLILKAEVSLHIGYYLGFLSHLAQERRSPHPTQNIMTLILTFASVNQNILAWATLLFAMFAPLH